MQIIVDGSRDVQKLIFLKYSDNVEYTYSRFLLRHSTDEGELLCNTLTGEVVLLSTNEKEMFDNFQFKDEETLAFFVGHGFWVPKTCNETKRCDQLRNIFIKKLETNGNITYYNILPTTGCNAKCFYCYESDIKHINMSMETAERLVGFISSHYGGHKVHLAWFGGEPTLGIQQIDYICNSLIQQDIPFESEMVSNAYLFDQELVKHAKELWHLHTIQITLDGTEEVYNQTKSYVSIKDNAYYRVLRNIKYFLDNKVYVNIRLNMDKHNVKDLETLIDELTMLFHGEEYLAIYVQLLKEDAGFTPIKHTDEDVKWLKTQFHEMQEKLEKQGWKQIWRFAIPSLRILSCMADNPCGIQCTPDGVLGKCEDYIYEHTVGNLYDGINNKNEIEWWKEKTIFDDCKKCVLYPSCIHLLKNCPTRPSECDMSERQHRIQLTHEEMQKAFEHWKANQNNKE